MFINDFLGIVVHLPKIFHYWNKYAYFIQDFMLKYLCADEDNILSMLPSKVVMVLSKWIIKL